MRRTHGHIGHALPVGYREIGSICTTGKAAFKVPFNPTSGTHGFEFIFRFDSGVNTLNEEFDPFGIYCSSGYTYWMMFKRPANHSTLPNSMVFHYLSSGTTYDLSVGYDYDTNAWQKVKLQSQTLTACDGTTTSSLANPRSGSYYGYIGVGTYWNGQTSAFASRSNTTYKVHIRYLCLYNGTTKVRELIPCIRKSDNKIGMYETVGGTFYSSETGTEFTEGKYW